MSAPNRKVKTRYKGHVSVRAKHENPVAPQFTPAQAAQLKKFLAHWEIDNNGNLLPKANNSVDLGSAEQKVRDIYEADT